MQKFFLGCAENIAGKGENAGHQHFLLFPQCFQKASFSGSLRLCGKGLNDRDKYDKSFYIELLILSRI